MTDQTLHGAPPRRPAGQQPARQSLRRIVRRSLVATGIGLSLVLAIVTFRAAAEWTAAAAPDTRSPATAQVLQARLTAEQARSAALATRLAQLNLGTSSLATHLAVAEREIARDSAVAADLRASLTATAAKVAALQRGSNR